MGLHLTQDEYKRLTGREPPPAIPAPVVRHEGNRVVYCFNIPGTPVAKPRMTRQDKWMKRPRVVRYREWSDRVKQAVAGRLPPAEKVLELNWTAYLVPPMHWSKKRRLAAIGQLHRQKPDVDNIFKGLCDTLYPGGDQAIAAGTIRKEWSMTARMYVEIVAEA